MEAEDEIERIKPTGRFGGAWTVIGDRAFRIPALALLQIQELEPDMAALQGMAGQAMPTREQMKSVARIVHASLSRNYPDMPVEEVEQMLDLSNFIDIATAVLSVSGFVAGKAKGALLGEMAASTGTASTAP